MDALDIDCETGEETYRALTPEEEAEHLARGEEAAAAAAREQAAREQRAADIALLAASADPVHQAMVRLLNPT